MGFPGDSEAKESVCNAVDLDSIPGSESTLEKGMATHSSILVWRTPRTEETGRLQSMGSQRVGHNRLDTFTAFFMASYTQQVFNIYFSFIQFNRY